MQRRKSFLLLRYSLFTALGLGALGCGAEVSSSSGGAGGSGGSGGAGGTSGTGGHAACSGAAPIFLSDGSDSGYLRCDDGTIHRQTAVACDTTIGQASCIGTEPFKSCTTDADCTAKAHGKCGHFEPDFGSPDPTCGCVYACADDSECGADSVCVCNGVVNNGVDRSVCASSSKCQVDADCASGECGITSFNDGCFQQVGLACRASADDCRVDADCLAGFACAHVPNPINPMPNMSPFTCQTQNCAIGRPLLVDGRARTANAAGRGDWAFEMPMPDITSLAPALRESLASAWTEIAALEHASIGSFARFSLTLLALGAPADLLWLTQEAAADEVSHARIAYALASHFKSELVGPAELDLSGVVIVTEKRAVLASLIEEACVGETLGAAEALALSQIAEDPALRGTFARVAADEERHAELAWKTLRFLLASADVTTRRFVKETFDHALDAAAMDPTPRKGETSAAWGLLPAHEIGSIRRQALRDVVRPLADALLFAEAPKGAPMRDPNAAHAT